jgi:hypothetical protein
MIARTKWTQEEFASIAKQQVNTTHGVLFNPLGLDTWEIMEGHVCETPETRKMTIKVMDTDHRVHELKIRGDSSLKEIQDAMRIRGSSTAWNRLIVKTVDGKPFWIEDKSQHTVTTQYDPDVDFA